MATATGANGDVNFRDKYLSSNIISRHLVDGFFGGIKDLVGLTGQDTRSAIEVGCGEGFSSQRIVRFLGPKVAFEALDVDPKLVQAARANNPGAKIEQGTIYDLKKSDKQFDLVFTLEVLEHLDDPAKALREIKRIAKKWLIISVPREPIWSVMNMARGKYWSDWGNTPGHIQRWSTKDFRRFIGSELEIQEMRTPLPWTILLCRI